MSTPESITATGTVGSAGEDGPEIEGAIRRQVPLLGRERIVRHEREPPAPGRLDVRRAGQVAQPWRARPLDDEGGNGREALDVASQSALQPRQILYRSCPNRVASSYAGLREDEGDRKAGERGADHPAMRSVPLTPAA